MTESEIDARSSVSGGNLQAFLCVCSANFMMRYASSYIKNHEDARNLLTEGILDSSEQFGLIRSRGMQCPDNPAHYVDIRKWFGCVTSKFALLHASMSTTVGPASSSMQIEIARKRNDAHLEKVASEVHFHKRVLSEWGIKVFWYKHSNMDQNKVGHRKKSLLPVTLTGYPMVMSEGGDHMHTLKDWARNPSKMGYWIPLSGFFGNIHAVLRNKLEPANPQYQFCILQLANTSRHECSAEMLLKVAKPFLDRNLHACFVALVPNEATLLEFQWSPELTVNEEVAKSIPLYVAFQKAEAGWRGFEAYCTWCSRDLSMSECTCNVSCCSRILLASQATWRSDLTIFYGLHTVINTNWTQTRPS